MVDKLVKLLLFNELEEVRFTSTDLIFSFGNIKSRYPSVVYFKLYTYDMNKELINMYTSEHQIVTTEYSTVNLNLKMESTSRIVYYNLELIFDGLDGDNPCSFNQLMFQEAPYEGYHRPSELTENVPIGFVNSKYVNLYYTDGYLQVIRPNKDKFHTGVLDASECTVLAPHFNDDSDVDDDVSVFFEFANQREQSIDILK